jgi:ribosomal-protein-alanine N-acetyltransferase
VAEVEWAAEPAGVLVALCAGPDWELENIAVRQSLRRQGLGAALLERLLEEARQGGAERVLLEVRASNGAAIRGYERAGFRLLARRAGYYREPSEDALIMVHEAG